MERIAAFVLVCSVASWVAAEEEGLSLLQTVVRLQDSPSLSSIESTDPAVAVAAFGAAAQNMDEKPLLAAMAAAPFDATAQVSGCAMLVPAIAARPEELAKPFVIEPILQAVKNNVANRVVVKTCMMSLAAFQPTFNRPRTLAINNGTHIAEAVAAVLRHYAHDRDMQKDALLWVAEFSTYVACETQPPFVDVGCMDLVWDALDYFKGPEYSDVQMSSWQAFSDHSGCPYSATAIANHGGKNAGARRVVEFLREAQGNHFHPDQMHGGKAINLQYEIITVGNGLLQNADGAVDAMVQAGYGPLVLSSMRDQPDERSTNDRACAAIQSMSQNATIRPRLLADGTLELVASTMERFKGEDHQMFVNAEVGDFYPVLPSCNLALLNFASDSTVVQDTLLELGVLETYETMREDFKSDQSMHALPMLLRARKLLAHA